MSALTRNTERAIVAVWMEARTHNELVDEVSSRFGLTAADIIEDSMSDGWPVHERVGLAVHCRHPAMQRHGGGGQLHYLRWSNRNHRRWCVGPNPLHEVSP